MACMVLLKNTWIERRNNVRLLYCIVLYSPPHLPILIGFSFVLICLYYYRVNKLTAAPGTLRSVAIMHIAPSPSSKPIICAPTSEQQAAILIMKGPVEEINEGRIYYKLYEIGSFYFRFFTW